MKRWAPAMLAVACLLAGSGRASPKRAKETPPAPAPTPTPPAAPPSDFDASASLDPAAIYVDDVGRAMLTVRPHPPWHLKAGTPFDVAVTGSEGLAIERDHLTAKDFLPAPDGDPNSPAAASATEATLASPFVARTPGAKAIVMALNFFLCTDTVCQRHKRDIALPFEVQPRRTAP